MKIKYASLFFLFILLYQTIGYGQKSIGILFNKNNYPVKVIRDNKPIKIISNTIELLKNDKIVSKKLDNLIFSWAPYAHGTKINDTTMEATEIQPEKISGLLSRIGETISNYLGFIKEDFLTKAVAQRNNEVNEVPDSFITTVDFLPIKFSNSPGEFITLFDKNNQVLFKKEIKGENSFVIVPQKLNLKADSVYSWKITGKTNGREGKIRILNNNYQRKIKSDFESIDKIAKNKNERIIKKASYLEMFSDIYENDLDLYWLSIQMLGEINFSKYPEAQYIESRYYQHIKKE